jgi:hypothetical protein
MRSRPRVRATLLALWLTGVVGNPALMLRCPIATAGVVARTPEPCSQHTGTPSPQESHKPACCRCPGLCIPTVLPSMVARALVLVVGCPQGTEHPLETREAARIAPGVPFATGPPLQS